MKDELALTIANTIINGFARHFAIFTEITQSARNRFQQCQWNEIHRSARARTNFYDERVTETFNEIKDNFNISSLDDALWQRIKAVYSDLLIDHNQPELAETFYNSVFCHLFERKYYHNDYIYVESTAHRLDDKAQPEIYTSYQPKELGLKQTICDIMNSHRTVIPFEDLDRDVDALINTFRRKAHKTRVKIRRFEV